MVRATARQTHLVSRPGCLPGQHTRTVLREVRYSDEQITALQTMACFGPPSGIRPFVALP
jgi:crotonobetainyl-CoA:carnitine CoA-transferase CaiB-like acyl-CoA transferase